MKKILLVGPSEYAKGGVSTVNKTILHSETIKESYNISQLTTYDNNNWKKLFLKSIFKVRALTKDKDLLHISMSSYGSCYRKLILIKLTKKKYLIHLHSGKFFEFYNSCSNFVKKEIKTAFINAEKICCVSSCFIELVHTTFGIDYKKITYVYNGIVANKKYSKKCNKKLNVLFMGALIKERHITEYLELARSFKECSDIAFHVAGNGNEQNWEEYGVVYHGFVEGKKKDLLLDSVDILVDDSFESFGISVVECMNHGVCVIGSNIGSLPEILEYGKSGILFNDRKEIATILSSLMEDKQLLHTYQDRAFYRSLDFDNENFEEGVLELYNEILKSE